MSLISTANAIKCYVCGTDAELPFLESSNINATFIREKIHKTCDEFDRIPLEENEERRKYEMDCPDNYVGCMLNVGGEFCSPFSAAHKSRRTENILECSHGSINATKLLSIDTRGFQVVERMSQNYFRVDSNDDDECSSITTSKSFCIQLVSAREQLFLIAQFFSLF